MSRSASASASRNCARASRISPSWAGAGRSSRRISKARSRAGRAIGQRLQNCQRLLEPGAGVLERRAGGGLEAGLLQVVGGLIGQGAVAGVMRESLDLLPDTIGLQRLDGVDNAGMQRATAFLQQPVVGDLVVESVREGVLWIRIERGLVEELGRTGAGGAPDGVRRPAGRRWPAGARRARPCRRRRRLAEGAWAQAPVGRCAPPAWREQWGKPGWRGRAGSSDSARALPPKSSSPPRFARSLPGRRGFHA